MHSIYLFHAWYKFAFISFSGKLAVKGNFFLHFGLDREFSVLWKIQSEAFMQF